MGEKEDSRIRFRDEIGEAEEKFGTGLVRPVMLENIFKSKYPERDKFLSRLFGIFSEDVVRAWCSQRDSSYEDLGRPTIKLPGENHGYTLDFCLRSRSDNQRIFVGELKCELEFDNYRYMTLSDVSQIRHHENKEGFSRFLSIAKHPDQYEVTVKPNKGGKFPVKVSGSILIWGNITTQGRNSAIEGKGFEDVLSVEKMIRDMVISVNRSYYDLIRDKATWCQYLFDNLVGNNKQ